MVGAARGVASGGGADGKVSIERLCLSPHVEKPFNSKLIKFRTWTKKSEEFFGIPMLYMDIMNVLRTGVNMSISRIHIWLCNKLIPAEYHKINTAIRKD